MMEFLQYQWKPGPHGGTSDCYFSKTDDHLFLKLFHSGISDDVVEREYNTSKHIHDAKKISVSKALRMFEANGRKGIIYERVFGKTYADMLKERSISPLSCGESFGREALKLHSTDMDISWLPSLHDEISESIDFVLKGKSRRFFHCILDKICENSGKDVFLHGDLHPGNIMAEDGRLYWIDIGYASSGPALMDLAGADIMLNFPLTSCFTQNPYGLTVKEMKKLYTRLLETYFQTDDPKEIRKLKKKIRLCSALYVINIIRKENWKGADRLGMMIIAIIEGMRHKEHI